MHLRVIGSDTATIASGWSVIDILTVDNSFKVKYIDSGTIRLKEKNFNKRVKLFFNEFKSITAKYCIEKKDTKYHLAIEDVFVDKNPQSALKLAKVHGIPISCICEHDGDIFYYHPTTIKKVVTGDATAKKSQIARCVSRILGVPLLNSSDYDRSDACAIALTHIMKFLAKNRKKI